MQGVYDDTGEDKMNEKVWSGRFILTIIAGLVFAYCSVTKILPIDKIHEILLIIIYAYFSRNDRAKDQTGGAK